MVIDSRFRRFLRCLTCALVLLPVLAATAAAQGRVVAVGDVHGAYDALVAILQKSKLVDSNRQWIGGSSILVQVGDIPDRGAKTRQCLDLLMELEKQAEQQKGRVIGLLGNHEVMNIMGDLRYVSPAEYQEFATGESEKLREQAWQEHQKFVAARKNRLRLNSNGEPSREKWLAEHPPGFFEHRDAYGPQGQYGRWLRKHDAAAQVGDVVFIHGGLSPKLNFRNLGDVNRRVRDELATFDSIWQALSNAKVIWRYMRLEEVIRAIQEELVSAQSQGQFSNPVLAEKMQQLLRFQSWAIASPEGPLWYRGLTQLPEGQLKEALEKTLGKLKARYSVIGHSPTASHRIVMRCERVFLIDTGMQQEYFRGQPAALEIESGRFTGYYLDADPEVLLAPPGATAAPIPARNPSGANP